MAIRTKTTVTTVFIGGIIGMYVTMRYPAIPITIKVRSVVIIFFVVRLVNNGGIPCKRGFLWAAGYPF